MMGGWKVQSVLIRYCTVQFSPIISQHGGKVASSSMPTSCPMGNQSKQQKNNSKF